MAYNLDTLKVFLKQLTTFELISMRHDAVLNDDKELKKLIDEEMKQRLYGT